MAGPAAELSPPVLWLGCHPRDLLAGCGGLLSCYPQLPGHAALTQVGELDWLNCALPVLPVSADPSALVTLIRRLRPWLVVAPSLWEHDAARRQLAMAALTACRASGEVLLACYEVDTALPENWSISLTPELVALKQQHAAPGCRAAVEAYRWLAARDIPATPTPVDLLPAAATASHQHRLQEQVLHYRQQLEALLASTSWRITAPLRRLRGGGAPSLPEPVTLPALCSTLRLDEQQVWSRGDDLLCLDERVAHRRTIHEFGHWPLLAVVLVIDTSPPIEIVASIESVLGQLYPRWELWLSPVAALAPEVLDVLVAYPPRDGRIRLLPPSADVRLAALTAAQAATGAALLTLVCPERLAELALFRMAQAIDQSAKAAPETISTRSRLSYTEWIERYDCLTLLQQTYVRRAVTALADPPQLALVLWLEGELALLQQTVTSVQQQYYPHWRLYLVGPAGLLLDWAEGLAAGDPRLQVRYAAEPLSGLQAAIDATAAPYVALLGAGDLLPAHALFCVARAAVRQPAPAIIYSDEDSLDEQGQRTAPYFKPDWNPELALSQNLLGNLLVLQRSLLQAVGGLVGRSTSHTGFDLGLACAECCTPEQIVHLPHILYHRRTAGRRPAQAACAAVVQASLARRGIAATAQAHPAAADYVQVRYALPDSPPEVTLIIPTRNGLALLRQCIDSVRRLTQYPAYRLLVIDNGSDHPATLAYLAEQQQAQGVTVLRDDRPFNYSALNNLALAHASSEVLVLLNNDIEVISPNWLEELVSRLLQPGVGAVGARLWYPGDTLQHGGVVLGLGIVAGHSHGGLLRGEPGYFGRGILAQDFSACTAACLAVRRQQMLDLGGLNATDLAVAFNDVDFCLRLRQQGYRVVWTPFAELYHHESATRGRADTPEKQARLARECDYLLEHWTGWIAADPAYNPNLALDRADYALADPPRRTLIEPC